MSDAIYLYQWVSLSPSSQSVPSSSSHLLLTFASYLLPFHSISSSVSSSALDREHFIKPFTVNSGEMQCHAFMIHSDYMIHLYFLVYKLIGTCEEDLTIFSTDGVNGIKNLNMCVLDFCVMSLVWSVFS